MRMQRRAAVQNIHLLSQSKQPQLPQRDRDLNLQMIEDREEIGAQNRLLAFKSKKFLNSVNQSANGRNKIKIQRMRMQMETTRMEKAT